MARPAKEAVILFAHGARDPQWAEPFQRLQERIRLQRPHIEVEIAFLELLPPTLLAAVDQLCDAGVTHVTIVPLFLSVGYSNFLSSAERRVGNESISRWSTVRL